MAKWPSGRMWALALVAAVVSSAVFVGAGPGASAAVRDSPRAYGR
jgi:hypothetical protein